MFVYLPKFGKDYLKAEVKRYKQMEQLSDEEWKDKTKYMMNIGKKIAVSTDS